MLEVIISKDSMTKWCGNTPGGGTLIYSSYVDSGPASTVHPKKISGISSTPQKILEIIAT